MIWITPGSPVQRQVNALPGRRARAAGICHPRGVHLESLRDHGLAKPGAWPDDPWGEEHGVAKVGPGDRGKIFAFFGSSTIGLKCGLTREEADEWLDRYPDDAMVMAYIGRSGWNTLRTDGAIPLEELLEALDDSYDLVVSRLPRRDRPEMPS